MFPVLSGREFDELVDDVLVNGLHEPVVVSGDELTDGRNPVRACAAAGVVPEVRELARGTDVASWVMSVNARRRHLDASQRTLLAMSALTDEVMLNQTGEMMVSMAASGLRQRPSSGHWHVLPPFRGAEKSSLSDPAVLTQK